MEYSKMNLVDELRHRSSEVGEGWSDHKMMLRAADAIEELRHNIDRYEFLRDRPEAIHVIDKVLGGRLTGQELDLAIDTAMAYEPTPNAMLSGTETEPTTKRDA